MFRETVNTRNATDVYVQQKKKRYRRHAPIIAQKRRSGSQHAGVTERESDWTEDAIRNQDDIQCLTFFTVFSPSRFSYHTHS